MRVSVSGADEFEDLAEDIRAADEVSSQRVDEQAEEAADEMREYMASAVRAAPNVNFGFAGDNMSRYGPRTRRQTITQKGAYMVRKTGDGNYITLPRGNPRPSNNRSTPALRYRVQNFGVDYPNNHSKMVFEDKDDGELRVLGGEDNPDHDGVPASHFHAEAVSRFKRDGVLEEKLEDVVDEMRRIIHDGLPCND